jgi:hypothetical protein
MQVAFAWSMAINQHDTRKAKSYFAPEARYIMDWGPAYNWGESTNLRCRQIPQARSEAHMYCTFHESSSPSEGQPASQWSIDFRRAGRKWLINNYGEP